MMSTDDVQKKSCAIPLPIVSRKTEQMENTLTTLNFCYFYAQFLWDWEHIYFFRETAIRFYSYDYNVISFYIYATNAPE